MVKANELRVGNRIIVRTAEYVGGRPTGAFNKKEIEVFAIIKHPISAPDKRPVIMFKDDDRMNEHFLNENVMPISLTPEWLRKFGFTTLDAETDIEVWGLDDDSNGEEFSIVSDGMDSPLPLYFEYDLGYRNVRKEIKYVHQLQNLYLALMGEELTIKQ